jgi:nucleoside-diphosphate kinase
MKTRTFSMIKPDATRRNISSNINAVIEAAGLKIVAQKMLQLTKQQAEMFYGEHKERPFFGELVETITSGYVIAQVLEAEDAVALYRKVIGATDPKKADPETVRAQFALSIGENSVHGSDSETSAAREISFFFSQLEIMNDNA